MEKRHDGQENMAILVPDVENGKELRQVARFRGFDAFDDFRKDDKLAILGEMSYYLGKLVKSGKLNP